jgi:hypothetical protein
MNNINAARLCGMCALDIQLRPLKSWVFYE